MRRATKWLAFAVILAMLMTFVLATSVTAHAFLWWPPQEEEQVAEEPEVPAEEPEVAAEEPEVTAETTYTGGVIEALIWDDLKSPDGEYSSDDLIDGITVNLYHLKNKVQLPDDATEYTVRDVDPEKTGKWAGEWEYVDSKVSGPGGYVGGEDAFFEYLHGWVGWNNLPLDAWDPTFYMLELVDDNTYEPMDGGIKIAQLNFWNLHNVQFFPMREEYLTPFEIESTTGAVSGTVWSDANADLIREFPEQSLEGWTVLLTDRYNRKISTTTTNKYGFYYFRGLRPGTYKVWASAKSGWKQVAPYYKLCTWPPWGYEKGHHTFYAQAGVYLENRDFGFLDMRDSAWSLLYYGLWWVGLLQYQF